MSFKQMILHTIHNKLRALCVIVVGVALMTSMPSSPATADPAQVTYRGALKWYIADLKTSFPEHTKWYSPQTALTDANYKIVLDGLKNKVKVNGIRLPIFPMEPNPATYSPLYKNIFAYAHSIGLAIYASPLSVGKDDYDGWTDGQYAQWLADYANYFAPDFLSPLNEAGMDNKRIIRIVSTLRPLLRARIQLIGPDGVHVEGTLKALSRRENDIEPLFDIIGSHNAGKDDSATVENWSTLVQLAGSYGKPVWSSENPREWEHTGGLPSVSDAVNGGVQGLVIWWAKPKLIDDNGQPTATALDVASHIVQ